MPAVRTVVKLSVAGRLVAAKLSVIATSLFGSAPWSPFPLTVEVTPQIVTVPSPFTRPVMLRRPSVAGAHGSPVAEIVAGGITGRRYTARQGPILPSGRIPVSSGAVEDPLLQPGRGLAAAASCTSSTPVVGVVAIAFVGNIERGGVGEPDPERERCLAILSAVGKPFRMHML